MIRTYCSSLLLALVTFAADAVAQVTRGEYFVDVDPGIGQATPMPIATASGDIAAFSPTLADPALEAGRHELGFRVVDAEGVWSHTLTRSVTILPPRQQGPNHTVEWFWATDPGFGDGQVVAYDAAPADLLSYALASADLDAGRHLLGTRVRNTDGTYSHTVERSVVILPNGSAPISAIEYRYVVDTDSSDVFTVPLSEPTDRLDLTFEPDTTLLLPDTDYELCVVVRRTDSVRSERRCVPFTTPTVSATPDQRPSGPVSLFPNPTEATLYLDRGGNDELGAIASAEVFDVAGRQVLDIPPVSLYNGLPVAALREGVYVLALTMVDGRQIRLRFVKQ